MDGQRTVRCWQCGARVTEEESVRRNPARTWLEGALSRPGRVDLCPDCDRKRADRRRRIDRACLVVLGLIAGLLALFALMAAWSAATRP